MNTRLDHQITGPAVTVHRIGSHCRKLFAPSVPQREAEFGRITVFTAGAIEELFDSTEAVDLSSFG